MGSYEALRGGCAAEAMEDFWFVAFFIVMNFTNAWLTYIQIYVIDIYISMLLKLYFSGGICEIFNTKKGVPENFFEIMWKAHAKGCMMAATIDVSVITSLFLYFS